MGSRFGWMMFFALSWLFAIAALPTAASPVTIGSKDEEDQEPIEPWSEATKQLDAAIRAGDKEAVEAAIEAGADLHVTTYGCGCDNGYGNVFSLVSLAITGDQPEIALILIEAGAALNLNEDGRPLCWAAKYGNLELVEASLEHGAEVEYLPAVAEHHLVSSEDTPLIVAIYGDHPQVVQRLIEAGADINKTTNLYRRSGIIRVTAIELARELEHAECLQLLEEAEDQESP